MEEIDKLLKRYKLNIRESDSPGREPIDFTVEDKEDNVAWVYGKTYAFDWECSHPVSPVWDGDEGRCPICGTKCEWHWEKEIVDEGRDAEENHTCKEGLVREVDGWEDPLKVGGLIRRYIKETYESK